MGNCIEKLLAFYQHNVGIDKDQEAILRYGLYIFISGMISYAMALIAGYFLGIFGNVLVMMIIVSILRSSSGGAHCESMFNCALFGAIVTNLLGWIAQEIPLTGKMVFSICSIVFLFGIWAIGKYAPADTPQKPITSPEKRYILKRKSLIYMALWYMGVGMYFLLFQKLHVFMIATAFGVLIQCMSITDLGYKIWHRGDFLIDKLKFH
ncbi:accessory gene regulator ArgB-like protein [Inediibacterium massiliense]|uniref:accessory gene regulator ArgB-like protein n=1 Tax=Inediibacterium massiliense TaxID=1658111 RepID=UPI0006B4DFDC|nr:accessory gene regulator B family protein [Inediibacterium massiliense]